MSICTIKILPGNADKIFDQKIIDIVESFQRSSIEQSLIIFDQSSKKPRKGFLPDSAKVTDYGMTITYVFEKGIIIPTFEGDKKEFQTITAECKFIKKEGILLISSNNAKLIDEVANSLANIFFPKIVAECFELNFSSDDLHSIIEKGARIVIEAIHYKTKGLDQIRLKAFDIQKKDWYIEEGFDSENVERYMFIPNLTGELAKKTVVCNIYKNGRFVIYQKQTFGEKEIEEIQFFIVKMISEILGSPLCQYGQTGSQAKLM
jgi:hypothetical protein